MQNLKIELTVEEANVVLMGLGELPAKASMNLIMKLQEQAKPQLDAQPTPEQEPGKKAFIPEIVN